MVRTGADEYIEKVKLWCRNKIRETRLMKFYGDLKIGRGRRTQRKASKCEGEDWSCVGGG